MMREMWDGNPRLVACFQGGRPAFDGVDTGVDTLFDFPLCYASRDVFARASGQDGTGASVSDCPPVRSPFTPNDGRTPPRSAK